MKTIIPINDKYRIELDRYSWAIAQLVVSKKYPGKTYFKQKLWYRTLSQAAEALLERLLADSELSDVSQIISHLDATGELIAASILASGHKDSYADEHKRINGMH